MRLEDLAESEFALRAAVAFCRHTPRWVGHAVARGAAWIANRGEMEIHATVQENLRHVLGPGADDATLREAARRVIVHFAQANYDFFHVAGRPAEEILAAVRVPERATARMRGELAKGRGVLVLFAHMSNFDLAGVGLAATGLPLQVLSLANPTTTFRLQNRVRAEAGMAVMPISPETLRAAMRSLRSGGIVVSSMDRPVPREEDLVDVFGEPSYVPLGPARMAFMTKATIFIATCWFDTAEGYTLDILGPIEAVRSGDRRQDILTNTRRLAGHLEEFVRARPEQWMMFHPFWPMKPGKVSG